MKHYYLGWKKSLSELNNFSYQIEFLQRAIRNHVAINKDLDIEKYLTSAKELLSKHEQNLYDIANETKSKSIRGHEGQKNFKIEEKRGVKNDQLTKEYH